jgi:hypothetical protein
MARVITLPKNSVPETAENPDSRVQLSFNTKLSEKQIAGGLQCKVQLTHPAFTAVVDIWKDRFGKFYITDISQKGTKNPKQWFGLCKLSNEAKNYILYAFTHQEDRGVWYLDMVGTKTTHITNEESNPDLGIVKITPVGNMTDNQLANDMLCKVNIETTIGTLYQYTIWKSKFGDMLYGRSPETNPDNKDNSNTAYLLSKEAQAQVLSFMHPQVDFSAEPDVDKEALAKALAEAKSAIDNAHAEGFEQVGDGMFGAAE